MEMRIEGKEIYVYVCYYTDLYSCPKSFFVTESC